MVKAVIPCAQLIYCRDLADFSRFAGPIGRYLARRGVPIAIIDSNGRFPDWSESSAAAASRNISRARSVRGSAISPIPEYAILGV